MVKEDSDQKKLNQLALEAQSFQQQGQAMQQQLASLQSTIVEIRATSETLKNIQNIKSKKVLLPIGSGVLVNAGIESAEKVLLDIGAGVIAEKPVPEAVQFLEFRQKKIEETRDRLQEGLIQVSERLRVLDKEAKVIISKIEK